MIIEGSTEVSIDLFDYKFYDIEETKKFIGDN
jgi:hypothetical protein